MKTLTQYIKEELDTENIIWKVEMYFKKHKSEYSQFLDIVHKCAEDTTVTKDNLEVYLKDTNIKLKPFIDFLDDDIYGGQTCEKDYVYLLKKVIECILGNKSVEM